MGATDRALKTADRIEDYQDALTAQWFLQRVLKQTSKAVDIENGIDKVSAAGLTFAYRSRYMTVEQWKKWGGEITITVASPKHPHPETYQPETVKWPTMTALIYTIVKDWPADGASLKEQEELVLSSTIVQLAENAELIREAIEYPRQKSSRSGCEFVCVPVKKFRPKTFRTVRGGSAVTAHADRIDLALDKATYTVQLHLFESVGARL